MTDADDIATGLPDEIAPLRNASAWDAASHIKLAPRWVPLSDQLTPPQTGGVYAIGVDRAARYDRGLSRIIYLGSTTNLKRRLHTHAAQPHNHVIEMVQGQEQFNLLLAWWELPGVCDSCLRAVEGEAILEFDRMFGVVPIANLQVPESSLSSAISGLVHIAAEVELIDGVSLDEIGEVAGLRCIREEQVASFMPGGGFGLRLNFKSSSNGTLAAEVHRSFHTATYRSDEEIERAERRKEEAETRKPRFESAPGRGDTDAGLVDGRPVTDYVETVMDLKREGRLEEAAALLLRLCAAEEAEAAVTGWGVAPWYFEHAAIVFRKLKQYQNEVQILERYAANPSGSKKDMLLTRLDKARALAVKKGNAS